jgi:hypothetical protein
MKNIKRHLLSKTHFAAMKAQLVNLGKARGIGRILKDSAF